MLLCSAFMGDRRDIFQAIAEKVMIAKTTKTTNISSIQKYISYFDLSQLIYEIYIFYSCFDIAF
jgi:predicted AAA+ superfamily ATPase